VIDVLVTVVNNSIMFSIEEKCCIIRKKLKGANSMSIPRGTKITCPDCKKEGNFTIWHSINVDVNPETRDKVKSGTIFEYICKNCGKVSNVEYRFLYHDCSNRFMIWYFPEHEYNINDEIEEVNKRDMHSLINEKARIVDDKRKLIEKIKIFEDRLDDIVIEVIKDIIRDQVKDERVEIFYDKLENDILKFWMSNNKGAGYPYSMYEKISNDYIIEEPKKCVIIDKNTAFKYLKERKS
jgi:hypothetical protein